MNKRGFNYLTLVFFLSITFSVIASIKEPKRIYTNFSQLDLKIKDSIKPIVYLDSTSFDTQEKFEKNWNMLYPWGSDHNGTARMYPENISLKEKGILEINSEWIYDKNEEESKQDPHLKIRYHSGAIHYKRYIAVTKELPYWEISGDFQTPIEYGTWPAFWITGAKSWPPEIDILEFKGNSTCWQNTVTGPNWDNTIWTTEKTNIENAASVWHNYKLTLKRIDEKNTQVKMYIDENLKSNEVKDFTNHPFWLIINMQMEGASGSTNTNSVVRTTPQYFRARNIYIGAFPTKSN